MSIFSRLFGRKKRNGKGRKSKDTFVNMAKTHSIAWANVNFATDAHEKSSQAHNAMRRFMNDESIDMQTRMEVVAKVSSILENFRTTCEYTGEPVSADMAELLSYAITGWTTRETNELLRGLTDIVQELLTNSSVRMSAEERKAVVAALMACRQSCAMRLARGGYSAQRENGIKEMLRGVLIDMQGNVGGSRILDAVTELNDELNWVIDEDIKMPTFTDYNSFRSTVGSAQQAYDNKLKAAENSLQRINKDMEAIRATYVTLAQNDVRRGSLQRKYDTLKIRQQACEAIAKALNTQLKNLYTLDQALKYISTFTDLTKYSDFAKLFKNMTYTDLLDPEHFAKTMAILETVKGMHSDHQYEPTPIFEEVTNRTTTSSLDLDTQAEQQKQKQNSALSALDLDTQSHNLK